MKTYTVGFELEFEGVSIYRDLNRLRALFTKFGDVKADGSLAEGFELASKIARDNKFRSYMNLDDDWQRLFDEIATIPVIAKDNTGMHVHVGRQGLSLQQVENINDVVYNNKQLDMLIGGRKPNRWCEFRKNSETEIIQLHGGKYRFLNVGRAGTIEFRFFQVPTSLKRFLCNMQYVLAIVDFASSGYYFPSSRKTKEARQAFLNYIKKGDYLDLNVFLFEHKKQVTRALNAKNALT